MICPIEIIEKAVSEEEKVSQVRSSKPSLSLAMNTLYSPTISLYPILPTLNRGVFSFPLAHHF